VNVPEAGAGVTLRASRRTTLLRLLGSSLFTLVGLGMLQRGRAEGWFVAAVFGICVVVFTVQVARPGSLTLTASGLSYRNLGRSGSLAWTDVAGFGVWALRGRPFASKMVGIVYTAAHRSSGPLSSFSRGVSGFDGALPDTYGYKAEELVTLLESWRSRTEARRE
jgi:hypothetical protein